MIHGIKEEEWNDFLEGRLDEEARDRIEAHLIGCLYCWELYRQMARMTQALISAGEEIRTAVALQDHQLEEGIRKFYARISEPNAVYKNPIQQRLDALTAILASMCGKETAHKALSVAAQTSPARTIDQVTLDNWTPFLSNLKSIATVMCGETGAHLVWESGQL